MDSTIAIALVVFFLATGLLQIIIVVAYAVYRCIQWRDELSESEAYYYLYEDE